MTDNENSCLPSPSPERGTCICTKSFEPLGGSGNHVTCLYHDGLVRIFTQPCFELHTIVPNTWEAACDFRGVKIASLVILVS